MTGNGIHCGSRITHYASRFLINKELTQERLKELRSQISEIGQEIDSYRTVTAASMGGGVFLLLLGLGAVYDLLTGNTSLWSKLGVARSELYWLAGALLALSLVLLATAFLRHRRRDLEREAHLIELEDEMADLLDQQDRQFQIEE